MPRGYIPRKIETINSILNKRISDLKNIPDYGFVAGLADPDMVFERFEEYDLEDTLDNFDRQKDRYLRKPMRRNRGD